MSDNTEDPTKKVAELLDDGRFAMVTTPDTDGTLISRPLTLQEVEFDGDLWFFVSRKSRTLKAGGIDANVSVTTGNSWVSLTGTLVESDDPAKRKELWNPVLDAWFPDGVDSPDAVLVKVHADSAEYWDSPGGRIATVISLAKSKLTGEAYDGGENERVEL